MQNLKLKRSYIRLSAPFKIYLEDVKQIHQPDVWYFCSNSFSSNFISPIFFVVQHLVSTVMDRSFLNDAQNTVSISVHPFCASVFPKVQNTLLAPISARMMHQHLFYFICILCNNKQHIKNQHLQWPFLIGCDFLKFLNFFLLEMFDSLILKISM